MEKYNNSNRRIYNENMRTTTQRVSAGRVSANRTESEHSRARCAVHSTTASEKSRKATARRKRKNKFFKCVFAAIAVFVVITILLCLPIFNINNISVSGNGAIESRYVESQLDYLKGMNVFTSNKGSLVKKYLFDFETIEKDLMINNGRIKDVKVKYSLGGNLKVAIEEATPVAVTEIEEKYYLVDRDWVVMEEFETNPKKKPKVEKQNTKKEKKKHAEDEEQELEQEISYEMIVYEEVKNLPLIKGLSRGDLCVSRVNMEKTGIKNSLFEAAWSFTELSNSPLKKQNNIVKELEVDNLFVIYKLKRGIDVKMGGFSNYNEEKIMYKAQFLESILEELPKKSCGTIDMFSSEKPVFVPGKKK